MTEYQKRPTKVGRSTSDGMSPERGKVCLRLGLKDNSKGLILNLQNVYYLPNSLCNLVSLRLLNNNSIFYNNKHKNLYQITSKKILAQAKCWKNSYLLRPLNLSNGTVYLLRVNANTYQQPFYALQSSIILPSALFPLFIWHKRLGHLNFFLLKTHLNCLNIKFNVNSDRYICNSCLQAKGIKTYYQNPQKQSSKLYQFLHTNLIRLINLISFLYKKYFFTFTDNATKIIETYIKTKKNNWLKYLTIYHSLCRTKSKKNHLIEKLRSDYRLKIQSHKANKQMQKERIIFEPSASYSQKQNSISQ